MSHETLTISQTICFGLRECQSKCILIIKLLSVHAVKLGMEELSDITAKPDWLHEIVRIKLARERENMSSLPLHRRWSLLYTT